MLVQPGTFSTCLTLGNCLKPVNHIVFGCFAILFLTVHEQPVDFDELVDLDGAYE